MPRPHFRLRSLFILTATVAGGCAMATSKSWPLLLIATTGTCFIVVFLVGIWLMAWFSWLISKNKK